MATGLFNLKQVNQAISQGAWSGYIAPRWVEYLVVAGGGGGGGGYQAGGGGAGGLLTGIVSVAAGASYTVTVGAGGTAGPSSTTPNGGNGVNSVFGSIASIGGGGGGAYGTAQSTAGSTGASGGSGGGAGCVNFASVTQGPAGQGTSGQGNAGGPVVGYASPFCGGGGGGAGTVGLTGGITTANGGAGIASSISGTVTTYAGGGGGGAYSGTGPGTGGVGGGGNGSTSTNNGSSGSTNTGGGGGGSGDVGYTGGAGGSGIVVVRYPGNVQFYTGGAVTYVNGYIVHIFYASGTLAPTTPAVVATDYQISRSLRFNSADSAYLSRTLTTPTNNTVWSFSFWLKRSKLVTQQYLLNVNSYCGIGISNDIIYFWDNAGANVAGSTAVFRDASAWYHLVFVSNGTTIKGYVNNSEVMSYTGTITNLNSAIVHNIGRDQTSNSLYLDGYMTEVNFIDGQALTPSSFGAINTNTGVWGPKAYTGTYGTNGFKLNFSDNSNTTAATLGADYSGNGNNWTPNNFSVTAGAGNDSLVDSPTSYGIDTGVGGTVRGNYCTFNPLDKSTTVNVSNGNLDLIGTNGGGRARASMAVSSGKWYFEFLMVDISGGGYNGFMATTARADVTGGGGTTDLGQNVDTWGIPNGFTGASRNNGTNGSTITGITNGQIGMFALDMDTGKFWYGINGTWVNSGNPTTGTNPVYSNLSGYTVAAAIGHGGNTYISYTYNFGQRPFAYTAPSGFKALCTQNLPAPTIGSSPTTLASKFFGVSTFTGDGTNSQTITNSGGFQPDWVWFKARSNAQGNSLVDSVRGTTKILISNSIAAEVTGTNPITFNSNGFTSTTDFSTGGYTYAAWQWRASNAAAVSNTAGTITSQVSVNLASGFSIVTYTGNSVAGATRGHGLNAVPKMIFVKGRVGTYGADHWHVYHASLPNTQGLSLNSDGAATTSSYFWNDTSPTSTVFTTNLGSSNNFSGQTYVAYCFAEVAGYSAFGSYTGNGVADGTFVYTGFRPAFIMIKRTDSGASDWQIIDTTRDAINASGLLLQPNTNSAESNATPVLDFLSNGFKHRNSYNVTNYSSGTYIYAAFAESPFKYSLAR